MLCYKKINIIVLLFLILTLSSCSSMRSLSSEGANNKLVGSEKNTAQNTKPSELKEVAPKEVQVTDNSSTIARRFAESMIRGDTAQAQSDCNPSVDINSIVETFEQLSSTMGKFIEIQRVDETMRTSGGQSLPTVVVMAAYEDESLMFSIDIKSGKITRVYIERQGGY